MTSAIAFATQDTDFATSIDEDFTMDTQKKNCPTQLLFASSANDTECLFHQKFKDYSMKMFMGAKDYFTVSMPCEIPLNPLMSGKPHPPLLKKSQVDDELAVNREKALREYFNQPSKDGGDEQMIKRSQIIRNSNFLLPELGNTTNKDKYIIGIDTARSFDNSIATVMKLCFDENIGYYGEIVNCVNLIDVGKKKKTPMKSPDQIKYIKQMIIDYNGIGNPDYENIVGILFDAGAGGGGVSAFADNLLDDWYDNKGILHKGFIDKIHEIYKEEVIKYPNASSILELINPKKYRNIMCEELLKLMELDLIKFPKEYNGKGYITLSNEDKNGEIEFSNRNLSIDEEISLINLDILKTETTAIHRIKDDQGNVSKYILPPDKERIMHDDRFYTLILVAHKLFELRRENITNKRVVQQDISTLSCVSSVSF